MEHKDPSDRHTWTVDSHSQRERERQERQQRERNARKGR